MTTTISKTIRVIPVTVAKFPIQTFDAEALMLREVDGLVAYALPHFTYNIEIRLYSGDLLGITRCFMNVRPMNMKSSLEEAIKGSLKLRPLAAEIKSSTTHVEISLAAVYDHSQSEYLI